MLFFVSGSSIHFHWKNTLVLTTFFNLLYPSDSFYCCKVFKHNMLITNVLLTI